MDPASAAGLALSVAALAGQVFTGIIQGIQFIVTARNLPEDSIYLNLRLRMEQQRLFAWSETSGLLEYQNSNDKKLRESKTFVVHRTTILDLLVQIQHLFTEFEKAQRKNGFLKIVREEELLTNTDPSEDSTGAYVPLSESRRKFIMKAMSVLKEDASDRIAEGKKRLKWAAFDKRSFEELLRRFSTLNDNMTDILDVRLQNEIHRTTQDTNRGVLQLHKDIASLRQLVMALDIRMQFQSVASPDPSGVRLLAQLAKFKAFNESLDSKGPAQFDEVTAMILQLENPANQKAKMKIARENIELPALSNYDSAAIRCEGTYINNNIRQQVWIEWKDYDYQMPNAGSPSSVIVERVQKLASLLHHEPKPEAFRVPHCLGYFEIVMRNPDSPIDSDGEDEFLDTRIGFVFEKPNDEGVLPNTKPVSLFDLLATSSKPRVTDRVMLAHAIANSLLYLHSVNWLHKGFRSHNIVFFPITMGSSSTRIDYSKPYLSGFDFSRPARPDEVTEVPGDIPAYNLYRHPSTQGQGFGPRESFRKSFDIYSLGVVLYEIANWRTIDQVLRIESKKMSMMTSKVRGMLLEEKRIEEVGACMGEMYETAAKKCIAGGKELGLSAEDMSDGEASTLSMVFYEEVVKKLGDIRV